MAARPSTGYHVAFAIVTERPAQKGAEPAPPWGAHDDAELVRRALDGDSFGEESLYRRHVRRVTGTAMRLLEDRAEAEDVVQEAFVLAFRDLTKLRDPSAFGAWLLQIAIRRVHRRFRRQRMLRAVGFGREGDLPLESLLSAGASPEDQAELSLLARVVRRMPAAERTAWTLRHVEGYKLGEIADACDCSLATAKRRLEAARARLERHKEGRR